MAYMLGITMPEKEDATKEIRIEVGDKIHLTAGEIFEHTQSVYMMFDRDEFKSFAKKVLELIEMEENGEA